MGPSSLRLRCDLASFCLQVGSAWASIGTVFPPPSGYGVCTWAPLLLHVRSDLAPTCLYHPPAWTHNHLVWDSSWPPLASHFGPILDKSWPHLAPLGTETVKKGYLLLHLLPRLLFAHLGLSWAILGPSWLQLRFIFAPPWPHLASNLAASWAHAGPLLASSRPTLPPNLASSWPLLASSRPHFASILASLRPPGCRNNEKRVYVIAFFATSAFPARALKFVPLGHLRAILEPSWGYTGSTLAPFLP